VAAEIAGLEVVQLLTEPTAAALSVAYEIKQTKDNNMLVFDLGGGTFDVSIVRLSEIDKNGVARRLDVIGKAGDNHLGGEDFDKELVKLSLEKWR